MDVVFGFNCSSWPHVADEWIHRSRSSGWPSVETVHTIVSEGCHVVAASHAFSSNREVEFRFSFSQAEVALFQVMSLEQKHCYASFKAIVCKSVDIYTRPKKRNVELIWSPTTWKPSFSGRVKQFLKKSGTHPRDGSDVSLFLVDQLAICLDDKCLPGYFIPQYNLLETIPDEHLMTLSCIVNHIRQNPIETAMEFLTSMVLYQFRPSHFFEYLNSHLTPLPSDTVDIEKIVFQKELSFLQNLILSYDKCECCDNVWWRHIVMGREPSMTSWLVYIIVSLLLNCICSMLYNYDRVWQPLEETAASYSQREMAGGGRFHWLEVNGAWR